MVTAYQDGDVEYFSLQYYLGCLKYWLRVLKPIEVIGMHVRAGRLSISLIYRVFWCYSVEKEMLMKHGSKKKNYSHHYNMT